MRNARNRLFLFLCLNSICAPLVPVPTEGAELYVPRAYNIVTFRSLVYPYGGSYLIGDYYARRSVGYPYVGFYYGNYYAAYPNTYYGGYRRPYRCVARCRTR